MLARVHILLPYAFTVPEGETYPVYGYMVDGYNVWYLPPVQSEKADQHTEAEEFKINGVKALQADVLRFDFQKEQFDRSENSECDPPVDLIKRVTNDFLARIRYVTSAINVKLIEFPEGNWRVAYLNDDGSELQQEKGLFRGRGSYKTEFSFVALNLEVWNDIKSLEPFQELPVWKNLLLDAYAVLPDVGPAVVLTLTALEVFISKLLDDLAMSGKIDPELWKWINQRGFLKDPSIEERYDFLSRYLIGKSIKENSGLWECFKNLKQARNSFAHDGIARIGDEIVTSERARYFIQKAQEMVAFIRNEMPESLRWPEYEHKIQMEFRQTLVRSGESND